MDTLFHVIEGQRKSLRQFQRLIELFDLKPAEAKTRGYIQSVLEDIEMTFRKFKEEHANILLMISENSIRDEDVPYLNEDIYFQFHDLFLTFKAKLIDLISDLQMPISPTLHTSTFTASNRSDSFVSTPRLPKIDLPKFSGEYIQWISYRDMFLSLVHNNTALSKVQKYFYLKGSCVDTPLEIVNQYPCSESSYELAWNALNNRYHNNRKLVDHILNRLMGIPAVNGSATQVKNLLDTTRSCLSLLKALGINTSSWNPILVYLTCQKLDEQTRKEWERSLNASSSIPDLDTMFTFLDTTFRTLECIEDARAPSTNHSKSKYSSVKKTSSNFSSKIFANNAANNSASNVANTSTKNIIGICPYCSYRHPLFRCLTFSSLSAQEKKKFIDAKDLCYNCLSRGHKTHDCKSGNRCRITNHIIRTYTKYFQLDHPSTIKPRLL